MKKILVTGLLILGVASFSYAATSTSLRIGTTGEEVSVLQQNLRSAGISVAVTGSYDQKTAEAVKKFQLSQGLVADGIAGKTTRAKLTSTTTKTAPTTTNNIVPGGNTGTPWATICDDGLPHLQVLTPNGGEVYNAGDQIKVTWRTCNISASEQVNLAFDTTFPVTAFGVTNVIQSNTGSGVITAQPSWFVPGGFQAGKFYKAAVYADEASDNSNATFTINGPTDICPNIPGNQTTVPVGYVVSGGQCVIIPTVTPSIKVISPNGGEVYTRGLTFQTGDFLNYKTEALGMTSRGNIMHRFKDINGNYFPIATENGFVPNPSIISSGGIQLNSNIPAGRYYLVANWIGDDGHNYEDQSNNYFTINDPTIIGQVPTVTTNVYSNLDMSNGNVRLNGAFNSNGAATSTYFEYQILGGSVIRTTSVGQTSQTGTFSSDLASLSTGNYQYRACGSNSVGTSCGMWVNFVISRSTTTVYACNDGRDNDGDGLKDYPADPGCSSATDNDEYNTTSSSVSCENVVPALIVSYENTSSDGPIYGNQSQLQDMGRFVLHARCDLKINKIGISNETSIMSGSTTPIFTQNTIVDGYGNNISTLPVLGRGVGYGMGGYDPITLTTPITMTAGSTRMISVGGTANIDSYNQIRGKKSKASIQIYNQHVTSLRDNKTLDQYPYSTWNLSPYYAERVVGWYTPADEQVVQ